MEIQPALSVVLRGDERETLNYMLKKKGTKIERTKNIKGGKVLLLLLLQIQ